MSINAISSAMAGSTYINSISSNLPNWLVDKLIDAGIDPVDVTSVYQGKKLLQEVPKVEKDVKSEEKPKDPLMDKVLALAEKLGIKVSENDTIEDIMEYIQEVIDALMKMAIKNNDEDLFNQIQKYQNDLNGIIAEYNGGGISNSVVYSFFDMVAEQNKYALKIGKKE